MRFGFYCFCGIIFLTTSLSGQSLDSLQLVLNSTSPHRDRVPLLKKMGEALLSQRNAKALPYFEELAKISESLKDNLLMAYSYNRMGIIWLQQNDINQSSDSYFKGLAATSETAEFNEIRARLLNNIGWNFSLMNKPERALVYYDNATLHAMQIDDPEVLPMILNNRGVVLKDLGQYDKALVSLEESLALNTEAGNQRNEIQLE